MAVHIIGFSTEDKDYSPQSIDICVVIQKLLIKLRLGTTIPLKQTSRFHDAQFGVSVI